MSAATGAWSPAGGLLQPAPSAPDSRQGQRRRPHGPNAGTAVRRAWSADANTGSRRSKGVLGRRDGRRTRGRGAPPDEVPGDHVTAAVLARSGWSAAAGDRPGHGDDGGDTRPAPRADSRSTRTAWCPSRTASKHVLSAGVVQVLQLGQRCRAQPVPAAWRLRWRARVVAGEDVGAQFGVHPFGLVGACSGSPCQSSRFNLQRQFRLLLTCRNSACDADVTRHRDLPSGQARAGDDVAARFEPAPGLPGWPRHRCGRYPRVRQPPCTRAVRRGALAECGGDARRASPLVDVARKAEGEPCPSSWIWIPASPRVDRCARLGHGVRGRRAARIPGRGTVHGGSPHRRAGAVLGEYPVPEHHCAQPEPRYPGDLALERPIRSLIRWNAVATVLRANKVSSELGGHIASFQSAATLYDVGDEHFWHAPSGSHGGGPGSDTGPLLAGHLRAGVPRGPVFSEEQMLDFREEVGGHGLSSYPHPWLMPDFGSSRPCPWAWARFWRSTRPASSSTFTRAAWPTPPPAKSGHSSATGR